MPLAGYVTGFWVSLCVQALTAFLSEAHATCTAASGVRTCTGPLTIPSAGNPLSGTTRANQASGVHTLILDGSTGLIDVSAGGVGAVEMVRGPGWTNATIFQTLGLVSITASGASNSRGIRLFHNTGAEGDLRISISDDTTVVTTGTGSSNHAIFANYDNLNIGTGDIEIANIGSLSTLGGNSYGIFGLYYGLGSVSASHSGTIATVGNLSHGIQLRGQGVLNAGSVIRVQTSGDITTAGASAVGVYVFADNNNSSALASIVMNGGVVTTSGGSAHGLYSTHRGSGHTNIEVLDGTVSVNGADAHGVLAQQTSTLSSGNISIVAAGDALIDAALADGIRLEVNPNIPSNRNAVDYSVHVRDNAVVRGATAGNPKRRGQGGRGDRRHDRNPSVECGVYYIAG